MKIYSIPHPASQLLENLGKRLFNLLKNKENLPFRSRKTQPCLKGIETLDVELTNKVPVSKDLALNERD